MRIKSKMDILSLKAHLLAGATVGFVGERKAALQAAQSGSVISGDRDNLHGNEWIFLRLGDKARVRMTHTKRNPRFMLEPAPHNPNLVSITDTHTDVMLAAGLEVESALVHCPKQLFFGLYEHCSAGCLFCPLTYRQSKASFTANDMIKDIARFEQVGFEGIGITTGIPSKLSSEDVGIELANVVRQLAAVTQKKVPIGISTRHPSKELLNMLREAGATEARLNIEIFNRELAARIMPNKNIDDVMLSIENACEIFGRGKVSSNMIVGVGESDDNLLKGVEALARLGAIATLYPYDPTPESDRRMRAIVGDRVGIPSAERLQRLAIRHKEILSANGFDKIELQTMCPACAASHIMPGKDL